MGTTDCLRESVQHTYGGLDERLDAASQVTGSPDHSRRGCPPIDLFCACMSQHLHAVDDVLLPLLPMRQDTHDYRAAEHAMAVVLTHVKGHEFGSTYETGFSWSRMWDDAREAMVAVRREEERLVMRLTTMLSDAELEQMTAELAREEPREPTRPHPYLPHTGGGGQVARRLMRVVDSFWDTAEGRYVPDRPRRARKRPGLLAQYLMADPRFDEEE